jgi:hypothetical protein
MQNGCGSALEATLATLSRLSANLPLPVMRHIQFALSQRLLND